MTQALYAHMNNKRKRKKKKLPVQTKIQMNLTSKGYLYPESTTLRESKMLLVNNSCLPKEVTKTELVNRVTKTELVNRVTNV
jgi:hypothetical protein